MFFVENQLQNFLISRIWFLEVSVSFSCLNCYYMFFGIDECFLFLQIVLFREFFELADFLDFDYKEEDEKEEKEEIQGEISYFDGKVRNFFKNGKYYKK